MAQPSADRLINAALTAAMQSHAPYSGTYAGIALHLADDSIVTGRHAENVAFNPGMPALQAGLIALQLRGHARSEITAVALVEADGKASQRTATQAVLATFSALPLVYARAVPVKS